MKSRCLKLQTNEREQWKKIEYRPWKEGQNGVVYVDVEAE